MPTPPYFTPMIDKYFADWILKETWNSSHPLDMKRFYTFVVAVHRLSKQGDEILCTYNEDTIKDSIVTAVQRNHPGFAEDDLGRLAEERTRTAMQILDCLSATEGEDFPSSTMIEWKPPLR